MTFAVDKHSGYIIASDLDKEPTRGNTEYICWQCSHSLSLDALSGCFTHTNLKGRSACQEIKKCQTDRRIEYNNAVPQNTNSTLVNQCSHNNTNITNSSQSNQTRWLNTWKKILSSMNVTCADTELVYEQEHHPSVVYFKMEDQDYTVYDTRDKKLFHYENPNLGGCTMTFMELNTIDTQSTIVHTKGSIVMASDGELYRFEHVDNDSAKLPLVVTVCGQHTYAVSLIVRISHKFDLSQILTSPTSPISPSPYIHQRDITSGYIRDVASQMLMEFAESVRISNGWSNYSFALPDTVIYNCAQLRPPFTVQVLRATLGNNRFEKYGNEILKIIKSANQENDLNPVHSSPISDDNDRLLVYKGCDVQPSSLFARRIFDEFHRKVLVETDPTIHPLRIVQAPAGGGKSTLLLNIARHWTHQRFGFITFSKDLAEDIRQRIARFNISNVEVNTMDALCKRSEAIETDPFITTISDAVVVRTVLPWCTFGRAKGSSGIGNIVTYALNSTSQRKHIRLCPYHKPMEHHVNAIVHNTDPKGNLIRNSFPGCRHRAFVRALDANNKMHSNLLALSSRYDCLLVDEVQDLTAQAVHILRATRVPLVAVGDPLQEIFSFGDDDTCEACKMSINSISLHPYRTDVLLTTNVVRLYSTFRLNPFTCEVLEQWTQGRFQGVSLSNNTVDVKRIENEHSVCKDDIDKRSCIRFVKTIPDDKTYPGMLFLCRTNKEVIEMAQRNPSMRVVQGDHIANEIRTVHSVLSEKPKKGTRLNAIQRIVLKCRNEPNGVEDMASNLEKQTISLDSVTGNIRAVCTVHRAKGFEAQHITITQSVYDGFKLKLDGPSEQNVSFVGASRHTHSLHVLINSGETTQLSKKKSSSGVTCQNKHATFYKRARIK